MVLNNAQLHHAVTFSNKVFRKDKEYSRYVRRFRDRAIYPSFTVQPYAFSRYDMDIPTLIRNLGWESLFEDQRFTYCLEAMRLFYVNLKRGSGPDLYSFKTAVGNFEITVTADLLASELGLPHDGLRAGDDGQFCDYDFDYCHVLDDLVHDIGRYFPNLHSAGRLPDDLRVLHFFITRILLLRSLSSATLLHTSNLWILHHARSGQRISYALLVFCHLVQYGDDNNDGWLPLAPLITQLLRKLGIDLRDKVTLCNVHDDLKAQHVLAHLDASVGPRKPVIGLGGKAATLIKALVSAAEVVIDRELTGFSNELKGKRKIPLASLSTRLKLLNDGGGASTSRIREEDEVVEEPEDNADISDYDSPPHYPF
ncbi:unnamed protein product [Linum trigynum]|uniref:Uncharacterized protein n=1 Tax=Linum trigynum TaxID=586398 RepID=A0AAV2F751_9ROSI